MERRILNDALRTIVNAEKRGFASAKLQPVSNVILKTFKYTILIELVRSRFNCLEGSTIVELSPIKAATIENYKVRQWRYVVLTTPNGVLDHEEAQRQNVGGQVVGYFY